MLRLFFRLTEIRCLGLAWGGVVPCTSMTSMKASKYKKNAGIIHLSGMISLLAKISLRQKNRKPKMAQLNHLQS
ncbi:MAG: hypothetical protein CMN54_07035 [SAR324 cluster bacterium]|uniref:Uncharacterized protein n=1 Tax=SAR324 cluster bacterium TaxID=2024889 RepID=A0A2D6YJA1_9DELT|nr:hypothetical protein [SAR324 cluster bacterium]